MYHFIMSPTFTPELFQTEPILGKHRIPEWLRPVIPGAAKGEAQEATTHTAATVGSGLQSCVTVYYG